MDDRSTPKIEHEIGTKGLHTVRRDVEIRDMVRRILKAHRGNRAELAAKLAERVGFPVTINMLNDWCTPTKQGLRFPLSLARAFCEITGSDELAFLGMPDHLREQAELGKALQPFLEKWAKKDRAKPRGKQPRKKGASK